MHCDVYSLQAEAFMSVLKPLLPDTPAAKCLRDWDLQYTADSEGAYLFERFYEELYREVFGKGGLGERVVDALRTQTGAFVDFYHNFDRILLAEGSAWFNGRSRDEIFREVASVALRTSPRKWGDINRFEMTHLFFNGRLPRFLGFDRGPFVAQGGRATIHQAQFYTSGNRRTSFLPSFRVVTDLASDEIHTNMAGGPSDRRFSKWYCSEVKPWLTGKYKRLSA
jgi:penicillin amidase